MKSRNTEHFQDQYASENNDTLSTQYRKANQASVRMCQWKFHLIMRLR